MQNNSSESVSDSTKAGLNLSSPANQLTKETKPKSFISDFGEYKKTNSLGTVDSPQQLQERLERLRSFNQPFEAATPKRFTPYNPSNMTPTTQAMTPQSNKKDLAAFLSPSENEPDYHNLTPPMKRDPPEGKHNAHDTFTIPSMTGNKITNYTIDNKGISVEHEEHQNFLSPDRQPNIPVMSNDQDAILLEAPFDQLRDELKYGSVQIHRIIIETIQKVPGSNVPLIEQRIVYPNYQRSMADDAVDEMQIILEQHSTHTHSQAGSIQEINLTPSGSEKRLSFPSDQTSNTSSNPFSLPKEKLFNQEGDLQIDLPKKVLSPRGDPKLEKPPQVLENSKDKTTPIESGTQNTKSGSNILTKASNVSQSTTGEGKDNITQSEKSDSKPLGTEKTKRK